MVMKINVTNILLFLLILILGFQTYDNQSLNVKEEIIKTPEIKGNVEKIIERVVVQPIYINGQKSNVDSEWKRKYDEAVKNKDSVEQRNLYLESIKIRDYNLTLVDNDTIKIQGEFKTRGKLLEHNISYKVKSFGIKYTPKTITRRPRLMMRTRFEATTPFLFKGGIEFENRKGNGFSISYDTEHRIWIGVSKSFKIIN